MECSGRSLDGIGIDTYAVSGGNDYGIYTGTLGGPCYCTEVPYIGHAVQKYEKGVLTLLKEQRHQILNVLVGDLCGKRYHSLVVLACDTVQFLQGNTLNRYVQSLDGCKQLT